MFFIIGRERSGTTLLKGYLDAHPNLAIPPEYPFIMHLQGRYKKKILKNSSDVKKFCSDFFSRPRANQVGFSKEDLEEYLMDRKDLNFPKLIELIFLLFNEKNGQKKLFDFGSKNPIHALHIKTLISILPKAKFIFLVRDYHTQIASMRGVQFETHNSAALAIRWKYYYEEYFALKELFPEQFYCIKFEELLNHPEKELRQVCNFLDIPFSQEMILLKNERLKQFKPYNKEIHKSTIGEINLEKISNKATSYQPRQLNIIEIIAGKTGRKFGYQTTTSVSTVKKSLLLLYYLPGILYGISFIKVVKLFIKLPFGFRVFFVNNIFSKIFSPGRHQKMVSQ